jgi:hypothetical protein
MKLGRMTNIPFSLSVFPSLASPGYSLFVCTSTAHLMLILPARGMLSEMLQISVHFTETQIAVTDPAVNSVCDLAKSLGVAALFTGFHTAYYKEVAVDHLVQECRNQKTPVVLCVLENRR